MIRFGDRVRETVIDMSCYEDAWPFQDGSSLIDIIAQLNELLEKIPEEHRQNVKIDFESEYDSSAVQMKIYYDRPPTAAEIESRKQAHESYETYRRTSQEQADRRDYERLKAKFEGQP